MLLSVVALTATYSFAQNANSGVTVTHNQGVLGFASLDCDGNFVLATLVTSNLVEKANGSKKYNATHNASAFCNLPSTPQKTVVPPFIANIFGFDTMEFKLTPGGMIQTKATRAANP